MKKNMITVRDVNKKVLRKFKSKIVEHEMKMGQALTEAMREWIKQKKIESEKIDAGILVRTKPFDWGKGTEKTSKEIDEILHLGNK